MVGVKLHRASLLFILCLIPVILFFANGCGKSGNFGFQVETDYKIDSLWAVYPIMVSGNQTEVKALIVGANSGDPLKDVVVEFSTDTDTIENVRVITDDSGIATTTFISFADSSRRTATITAKVTAEMVRTKRITIDLLPTNFIDPVYLFLTSSPDTVYADGSSRVDFEARVLDGTYSPLENHQVRFNFIAGNPGDLFMEVDNYALTGVDGKATAHLTAPNTSRIIIIDATVYGIYDTVSARDTIWVLDIPDIDFINLRAEPMSIPADGLSELLLSAYVTVGVTGTPAPDGTPITFTSAYGTLLPYTPAKAANPKKALGGELMSISSGINLRSRPGAFISVTDGGYAHVKLRSSTSAGSVECIASADVGTTGVIADTIDVRFVAGDPMTIVVTSGRSPINADGFDTTRIEATIYDEYSNPVSSGWNVTFATDKGDIYPPSAVTDSSGTAYTVLTSGVISGYAHITATCEGVSGFTEVLFTSTIPKYINLTASPNQLIADGLSSATVTAEVLDTFYNPVTDGVRLDFSSSLGTLSGARAMRGRSKYLFEAMDTRQALTEDGFASVTITTGTLADTCEIKAWFTVYDSILGDSVYSALDSLYIPFLPGDPNQIDSVTFSKDSILADGEDTCRVFAFASDLYHNPILAGHLISFEPEEGTVNPVSSNTDVSGRAQTELTSSRSVGWHNVLATVPGATPGSGDIYFYPILPDEIRLLMDVDSAVANGADSVLITAYITDDEDRPCSDGTEVIFRTGMGTFLPAESRAALFSAKETKLDRQKGEIGHKNSSRARIKRDTVVRGVIETATLAPMADSFTVLTGTPFSDGTARINLIAPTTIGSTWVYVSVATSDSTWATDSMKIVFVPDVPARIALDAFPDIIPADSSSTSTITASVFDAHSNRVGSGFLVEFEMAAGSEIFGAPVTLTDWTDDSDSSQAHTTFRSFYTSGEAVLNAKLSLYPTVSENVRIWLIGADAGEVILSTDSARIHIGSVMNVTANVYDTLGDPITDGTHVDFSVEPDSLATVVPSSPVTIGGEATAEFRPNTTVGSCILIATVGAIADTKTVRILPGAVANIVLSSVDDTLPADGFSTTSVTAECFDAYGNEAEEGEIVEFSTDLGSIVSPTTTDTLGIATTTFTSDVIIGTARIQASSGFAPVAAMNIELIGSEAHTLILTADSTHMSIDGSGLGLTAYCVDGVGRPVSDGTRIDFASRLGGFSSIFEFTVGGFVNTILISGSDAGIDTVVASADSGRIADTLLIRFDAGVAHYISLEADPDTLIADPRARSTITATCTDEYGNPLGAGRQVEFASSEGSIISPVITDSLGEATTEYSASDYVGQVRIDANIDLANAWIYIEQVETTAAFIAISATPNRVTANGVDSCEIIAMVMDSSAMPVSDGILVNFQNRIMDSTGAIGTDSLPMTPFATTLSGDARIWWRSPTYTTKAMVFGEVFGLRDSAIVDFIAGEPAGIDVEVDSADTVIFADGESRATIWAYVYDEYGNPIIGELVIFSASPLGTFVFDRGYTDSTGNVSVEIYSDVSGHTTIMGTAGGFTDYTELNFSPIIASEIFLSSDDVRIVADGITTTTIRAIVLDSMGVGVPDNTPVRFSTDSGFIFPGVAYTISGEATTTLRSGTTVCLATITGDAGDSVTGTTNIEFIPGEPAIIEFTPAPYDIPADGDTFTPVTVIVKDEYGNHVRTGIKVRFTTSLGEIDTANFTDSSGVTSVNLYAGTTPGTAIIWANTGEALAQATVTFYNTVAQDLYVYVDPGEVVADGRSTAEITGQVVDGDGMPVSDGSPVSFEVHPLSMGFITPSTAYTDSGAFRTTFNSKDSIGSAYIIARANASAIDSVIIDLIPGSADMCSIWATPTSIPADSFSTSICSVLVFDRFGNSVGSGDTVRFEVTRGTVDPILDVTNSEGLVVAEFTSGRIPGEARVRANSGDAWGETYITLTNAEVAYVSLTTDTSELVADGRSFTFARAVITDSLGSPVTNGTPVYFSVDTIAGAPEDTQLVSLSPIIAFTTDGEAAIQIFSSDSTGRVWIQACCTVDTITSICDNTFLDLIPGEVDSISVWAEDTVLPADGEAYTVVHAQLFDRYGNPLSSGITVNLATSAGTIQPTNTFTDGSGSAQAILTAPDAPSIARVDVTAGGRVGVAQVRFEAAPPEYLTLRADPRRIAADGETFSTITARVLNILGQPVRDGTRVDFRSVDGTGADFGTIDDIATTSVGEATVALYSETQTGIASVICSVAVDSTNFLYDTVEVQFTPGDPFTIVVEAYDSDTGSTVRDILIADGRDSCIIRVFVYDRYGNPVESGNRMDITISPDPTLGSIIPSFGYTILDESTNFRFLAGTNAGTAVITVTTTAGPVGTKILRLIPLDVASIDLFADSMTLTADGISSSELRAIALDDLGMAVSDSTPIFFKTDVGFVYPGVAYTNAGVAISSLRSSTEIDTATIVAYIGTEGDSGYVSDSVVIHFVSGSPQSIDIIPVPPAITADGEERSEIRTYVYDAVGNRVDGGYLVNYSTTLGSIDTLAVTGTVDDTTGVAITQLRSGITPGTALITATSGDATGIGRVDFTPDSLDDATIIVSIDPNTLVADGLSSAIVSGMVRNSAGNPISDGTPVRLFTIPDSLGDIGFVSPTIVYTDSGRISATFTASTRAVNCNIVAYVGDTSTTYIADTALCYLIPGEPDSIAVWANPDSIPADSFSTTICSVAVFDRYRNAVRGGVTVTLTTSLGEIFPTSDETNSDGIVIINLRSGFDAGMARIVARSGTARGETNVRFGGTLALTISLTIEDRIIQADGYSETTCRATVLDTFGNPVSDGTSVYFASWPDTLGDTLLSPSDTLGSLIPQIAYTTTGIATTAFRTGTQRGRVWISAGDGSGHGDQGFIDLIPGDLASIELEPDTNIIAANGRDQTRVVATLLDDFGNRLLSGEAVQFGTDLGAISPSNTFTNSAGDAYTILTAGTDPGIARVWAQSSGVFELTEIELRESNVGTLLLTANPVQLVADGMEQSIITCQVFDDDGSPVSDGTMISFRANPVASGVVISPKQTLGGNCLTTFTSSTDVGTGEAWIIGEFEDTTVSPSVIRSDSVRILLIPGPAATIEVWGDSTHAPLDTIDADGMDDLLIFARVLDQYGNRMRAGETVNFSTNRGIIEESAITDTSGIARALLTSDIEPGDAVIQAHCGSAAGYHQVNMAPTTVNSVVLFADSTEMLANGINRTEIQAYVYSAGGHLVSNNTRVEFWVDPDSLGNVEPSVAYTDSGIATIYLRSDTLAGELDIWGRADTDSGKVSVQLLPGPPSRLVAFLVDSVDSVISADGSSNAAVACSVFDRYSNPVTPGSAVSFTTTLGTIGASAFTNTEGYATTRLTAGTTPGEALITVRSGDAIDFIQVRFQELVADEIVLNIVPARMPGNGTSSADITAYVFDTEGMPVSDGTRVDFDHVNTEPNGIINPRVTFTIGGLATATLIAPLDVGRDSITANVGVSVSDTVSVVYEPGEPAVIEFDPLSPDSLPADGSGWQQAVIVMDEFRNPVNIGTGVTWETTRGEVITPTVVEDDSGRARTFISSTETGPALLTARSGDAVGSKVIDFVEIEANFVDIVANPIRINADGTSTSNITVTVLDTAGTSRPVSDGTPVFFDVIGSGVVSPRTAYTDGGQARATLTAGVIVGMNSVIATVTDSLKDTVDVEFVAGPPSILDFDPIPTDMIADGADTQSIIVRVRDAYGNPVANGLTVDFTINKGFVTPVSATGYNWPADTGLAHAVVVSGTEYGIASLSATCGSATNYATINFIPLTAESLVLVVDPPVLIADGTETAALTAVVFDDEGLPVSDGSIVRFNTGNGIINPAVAYTSGGIATSTLKSSTVPQDSIVVVADAGSTAVDTQYVDFIPGPPAVIDIAADTTIIEANGIDSSMITVSVFDQYGNSVGAGVAVNFSASLGIIVPTAYTDTTGQITVRLIAGTTSGWSNVAVSSGSASGNILIEFISTEVYEISMTVIPPTLVADGSSTADVSVVVLDVLGSPVSNGTSVRFTGLNLGSVTPIFATTSGGIATARIRAYTDTGYDTLIASSGGIEDSVEVRFISGAPDYILLYPAPDTVLIANETDTTRIFGEVFDQASNHVDEGYVVNFNVDPSTYGTIWAADVTDTLGRVDVPFRAGRYAGVAIIRASCEGAAGITQVELQPTDVNELHVSVMDRFLSADGVTSTEVSAFVTDSSGMEIADGTGVRFGQIAPDGILALLNPSFSTTSSGYANINLFAPTKVGSTLVYAYCDINDSTTIASSETVTVYFEPGNVAVIRFDTLAGGSYDQINYVELSANGEDSLAGFVRVEDAFANGITDATINLTLETGAVVPLIGVTNDSGRVSFKITAPNRIGTTYLNATDGDITGYLPIYYQPTTAANIALSVAPRGLPADGVSTAIVRAIVTDASGNPVSDGVSVRFTALFGLVSPLDSLESGVATATLVAADTTCIDTIWAVCQSETAKVTITYSAGAADEITINVNPDTSTVGSGRTSRVSGFITDAIGNPVALGTYVYISVDSAGMGSIADPVVATDDTGYYETTYAPGLKAGLTGITARVNTLTARKDFLLYAGPPHTIDLAVSRDFIYIRGVGEVDQSVLEAVIYDQYDNPVRDSSEVVFRIVDFPGGGSINPELIPGGGMLSDTVYTINGRASVTLRSGDKSGSIVVEATAILPGGGTFVSRAPRITVGSGLPYYVSVSVNDCNVRGWDVDGVVNDVMAIITDEYGNPVAPGTAVWFRTEEGAITTSSTTNDSGFSFATWYSATPRNDGIVQIIAETRDTLGERTDTVAFYSSGRPDSVDITVLPGLTYADTLGFSDVRVDVWDENGHPVCDSTVVQIVTNWGTVESPVFTSNECYESYAIGRYTARNVNVDNYCSSDTGGLAEVTATVGGVSEKDTIYLKHDTPNSEASSITSPESVPYGTSFPISVKIVDQWGNPICGEDVEVTGANVFGSIPATHTTGITGEASYDLSAAADSSWPASGVILARIISTGGTINVPISYSSRRRPMPPDESSDIPKATIVVPDTAVVGRKD
ncbi:Ig-like domain-containing protein [bacterium]|nr:Ig-like domain-containing protein [bacterium]